MVSWQELCANPWMVLISSTARQQTAQGECQAGRDRLGAGWRGRTRWRTASSDIRASEYYFWSHRIACSMNDGVSDGELDLFWSQTLVFWHKPHEKKIFIISQTSLGSLLILIASWKDMMLYFTLKKIWYNFILEILIFLVRKKLKKNEMKNLKLKKSQIVFSKICFSWGLRHFGTQNKSSSPDDKR